MTDYFISRDYTDFSDATESATSPTSARGNPLAAKVSSVLSASYADSDIRDALSLLDNREFENTAEARRQIRLDIQKDVIESNGDIIKEFSHVAEQLKRIGLTIASLNKSCEEMKRHVSVAHKETAPALQEAAELSKQKTQVEAKQQLLKAFNTHFNISDDDIAFLTSTAEPVNDKFFLTLTRAKTIQTDCEILLGTENQRLGSEIMEQTSKLLNGAFQKLYRWIQREFKTLNLENPQISSAIRRALRVLAERPTLFQSCLDFFAEARENILSDSFYTALTGTLATGSEDTSVKPIELVAHDPLRYVGDMLAWIHSAAVSEKEALEVLFISDGDEIAQGIQAGRDSEPWNKTVADEDASTTFDGRKALNDLVDRDIAGVAKVLRQRIGQVIQSHEEIIMAYKIANLLNFYGITFTKLLGDDSILLKSLTALEESALRQFRTLIRDHVANLQGDVHAVPPGLAPPQFLQEGLEQLTAIMKTFDTSFMSPESKQAAFDPIMVEAFNPFMEESERVGRKLNVPVNSIFAINCMLAARNTLVPFHFTKQKVADLQNNITKYARDLTEYQYQHLCSKSGLQPLILTLAPFSDGEVDFSVVRESAAFQPEALLRTSQTLDDFLPSALMDAMENLKHLHDSKIAGDITDGAAERFCDEFEKVEETLIAVDEAELEGSRKGPEMEALRIFFPRTSGEIRVLLT